MSASGWPLSRPTRSMSAASKSSSPFMARAVISATPAPIPACGRQFVDAFLLDHGAVHIRDQEFLAAALSRLEHQIDALGLTLQLQLDMVGGPDVQRKFRGSVGAEPDDIAATQSIAQRPPASAGSSAPGLAINVAICMTYPRASSLAAVSHHE